MAKNNAYPRSSESEPWNCIEPAGVSMDALAKQLGIASTTVANWIRQARIDDGEQPGITTADRDELTQLRREIRRLEMENEILKRAAAYFAKENVLPK